MKTLLTFAFIILFSFAANAQDETVTIKQETANLCAECFSVRKSLEDENGILKSSVESLKAEIVKLQIEKGQYFAELQAVKAERERYFALVQVCVQRKTSKQIGLLNFKLGN